MLRKRVDLMPPGEPVVRESVHHHNEWPVAERRVMDFHAFVVCVFVLDAAFK
jgi:hypothetical protein